MSQENSKGTPEDKAVWTEKDGKKLGRWANGTTVELHPDGSRQWHYPDGLEITNTADGKTLRSLVLTPEEQKQLGTGVPSPSEVAARHHEQEAAKLPAQDRALVKKQTLEQAEAGRAPLLWELARLGGPDRLLSHRELHAELYRQDPEGELHRQIAVQRASQVCGASGGEVFQAASGPGADESLRSAYLLQEISERGDLGTARQLGKLAQERLDLPLDESLDTLAKRFPGEFAQYRRSELPQGGQLETAEPVLHARPSEAAKLPEQDQGITKKQILEQAEGGRAPLLWELARLGGPDRLLSHRELSAELYRQDPEGEFHRQIAVQRASQVCGASGGEVFQAASGAGADESLRSTYLLQEISERGDLATARQLGKLAQERPDLPLDESLETLAKRFPGEFAQYRRSELPQGGQLDTAEPVRHARPAEEKEVESAGPGRVWSPQFPGDRGTDSTSHSMKFGSHGQGQVRGKLEFQAAPGESSDSKLSPEASVAPHEPAAGKDEKTKAVDSAARRGHDLVQGIKGGDGAAVDQILKDGGANLLIGDADGCTALHCAAELSDVQLVDRLLGAGAEVNALDNFDRTPLHAAALSGCGETCERLMTAGGDPSLCDLEGSTPADLARHKGHEGLAATLQGGQEPEVSFQLV